MEMEETGEENAVMAKGALWQNATNILIKLSAFVYTVIIARLVAQDDVGVFYFAIGILGTLQIFVDLGLTTAIMRYLPYYFGKKDNAQAKKILNLTVFLGIFLMFVFSAALFLASGLIAQSFGNPKLEMMLKLLSISVAITQTFTILSSLMVSMKKLREYSIGGTVQAIAKLVLTIILIVAIGADARSLGIAFMGSTIIAAAYLLYEMRGLLGWAQAQGTFSISEYIESAKELIPFGITMVGVLTFSTIIGYFDRIMLGYFLTSDANNQIAIYTLSISFAGMAALFAGSVLSIFYPVISELVGKGDFKKVSKTTSTALRWVLFSSIPITAFLVAFSAPLLRVLYGAAYEPGYLALALFSIGMFANFAGAVQRTTLAGMRLVKIELLSVGAGALTNIVLNIILIPGFGITGAAFAGLASFVVISSFNQYYAKKYFGFEFPKSAWKNILAGVVVFAILQVVELRAYGGLTTLHFGLDNSGILLGVLDKVIKMAILGVFFAFGSVIYLALLNLMNLFEAEDFKVCGDLLVKIGLPKSINKLALRLIFWRHKVAA